MRFGPGAMVAAAFIGPGTVTTATAAGASFGIALLWAVVFSVMATMILQTLVIRVTLATGRDLASLFRELVSQQWWGKIFLGLILVAIGVGNAAYESGNLVGAGLGLQAVFGGAVSTWIIPVSGIAALLLGFNHYAWLERVLVVLVALMALVFVGLAILLAPTLADLAPERLLPGLPPAGLTLTLALIGTTVVPYNLFLHSTAVLKRWDPALPHPGAVSEALLDSRVAIAMGGLITICVVLAAAALLQVSTVDGVMGQLVRAMDGVLPGLGRWLVGLGLFAAGLTSAIAAPLAAGWAVAGVMGWPTTTGSWRVRTITLSVLGAGVVFSVLAQRPEALILLAQSANGLLLPIVAVAVITIANSPRLMQGWRPGWLGNVLALVVLATVLIIAAKKLWSLF